MPHGSAHIVDCFWKLYSFTKWDKGMQIHADGETSDRTQRHEAFLMYVENEYSVKHGHVPVMKPKIIQSNNLFPSATASGSGQFSCNSYDLCSNDDEYSMLNNVAETTTRWSYRTAPWLTTSRMYLNSPLDKPQNWGQINPNFNDYHSKGPTQGKLAVHFGFWTSLTGGTNKVNRTHSMPISLMWDAT